jgi:hypothetical protein
VVGPDVDPAGIGGHVIAAVRDGLAELLVGEVVDVDLLGLRGRLALPAAVLERPHEFLLLGVNADHGWPGRRARQQPAPDRRQASGPHGQRCPDGPRSLRDHLDPTPTQLGSLRTQHQTPLPLIQIPAQHREPTPHGLRDSHAVSRSTEMTLREMNLVYFDASTYVVHRVRGMRGGLPRAGPSTPPPVKAAAGPVPLRVFAGAKHHARCLA